MYYLGIDLGTSSVKLLMIDENGTILGEAGRDYPVSYPKDKWAEQNPADWWKATKESLVEILDKVSGARENLVSISFSGQMHGLVAIDSDDEVLTPAILWNDQRTQKECDEISEYFKKDLSTLTGNKALTGFTAPKVLWVRKNMPDVFGNIHKILLPKDYIRLMLSGDYATDMSDASGMLMLDVGGRKYSHEMLNFLGIREEMMPRLYESYEVTGKLKESLKDEFGLKNDVHIVAGAGDQAAGAIGSGATREGIITVALGTSGVVFAPSAEYKVDKECRLHSFCDASGAYHQMGVMLSAANSLKWWTEEVQRTDDYGAILAEATDYTDVLFLPYLQGERTPYPDPEATGVFVGMRYGSGRAQMTRAVLDGIALGLKDSLDLIVGMGLPANEIRVIGGGARSPLVKQILADVFGKEIFEINTEQGGALGAAILAMAGHTGKAVPELTDMIIRTVSSYRPDMETHNLYLKKHERFKRLFKDLYSFYRE